MIEGVTFFDITVNNSGLFTGIMLSDISILVVESFSNHRWFRISFAAETNKLVGWSGAPCAGEVP